ncbi:hypothetical protein [Paraburkholderia sp. C35]|uniref:hypothetical protein n=1 Tax=Paraburkholderia sp. C35 TaxID=2126993 RepID=UPI0013A559DA|nr:hypothetical protein [Paraburkholderia sp. C35]
MELREQLVRDCGALLVRHFYGPLGEADWAIDANTGLRQSEDRKVMLLLWALSDEVDSYLGFLSANARHLVEARREATVLSNGGSGLLARESLLLQMRTGNPAAFLARRNISTPAGGPNHCLAWLIECIDDAILAFPRVAAGPWGDVVKRRVEQISRARTIPAIAGCFNVGLHRVRPSLGAMRAAATLRNPVYSRTLELMKRRDSFQRLPLQFSAARAIATSALASLKTWQHMELLAALLAAQALVEQSAILGAKVELRLHLLVGGAQPLATCGDLTLEWQFATGALASHRRAHHEAISDTFLEMVGLKAGSDRADIAVFLRGNRIPVAIGESKYFEKENNARNQLSLAIWQIVKYADQVHSDSALTKALSRLSFIFLPETAAVAQAAAIAAQSDEMPIIVPYGSTHQSTYFEQWARRLLSSVTAAPAVSV